MTKINSIYREVLLKSRVCFVRSFCPHCHLVLQVIERLNQNLPINKRIEVIDCYNYDYLKVPKPKILKIFEPFLEGYPTCFIDGEKIDGANTQIEWISYVKSRLANEFIIPYDYTTIINNEQVELRYEKECKFKKKLFTKRVICN